MTRSGLGTLDPIEVFVSESESLRPGWLGTRADPQIIGSESAGPAPAQLCVAGRIANVKNSRILLVQVQVGAQAQSWVVTVDAGCSARARTAASGDRDRDRDRERG